MKRILLLLPFLYLAGPSAISQTLESTTWAIHDAGSNLLGHMQLENDIMSYQEAGTVGYSPYSTYTLTGSTIEVDDTEGCPDPGTYAYAISDDTLYFELLNDACTERVMNFTQLHWVAVTTSIGETDALAMLNVYPNPSTGLIDIRRETPDRMWLAIHDLSGRIAHQVQITGITVQLDLGHLARGKYVITGRTGDNIQQQKLILE